MTRVVVASAVVAALVDRGSVGRWGAVLLRAEPLAAPHLMPAEAANILRRGALAGQISADVASLAHADLATLPVELFPSRPFAARVWELRQTVTCYDAWHVAVAEALAARPATLETAGWRPRPVPGAPSRSRRPDPDKVGAPVSRRRCPAGRARRGAPPFRRWRRSCG